MNEISEIEMDERVGKMRRAYFGFLACSLALLLLGGYFAWTGASFFMLPSFDDGTVYLCSAVSIVLTLALIPLGLKWPFLPFVRKWVAGRPGETLPRYCRSYVVRLCILALPVAACWGSLGLIPSESAFYLLVISVFPYLAVYPGKGRVRYELEEGDAKGDGALRRK